MFNRNISINELLVSLESVLLLEFREDMKTADTLAAAIERIENTYAISLTEDVFTLMDKSELIGSSLSIFMRDLKTALSQLSFYTSMKMYHKDLAISLSSVNYLGLAREELMNALRHLQDKNQSAKYSAEIMPPVENALDQVPMCTIKRIFCSLLMLNRLGVHEGVSILANLLYLGGLIV